MSTLASMTAVRLHAAKDLRVETIPVPSNPTPNDVVIRVAFAGICGSDLHNFRTGQWITRAPSVAGHEFSGEVERVGSAVTGFDAGDRVVVDSRYTCGQCAACANGKPQICETLGFVGEAIDGGFAEFVTIPANLLVKADPAANLDVLSLAEPLAVALHAIGRLSPGPKDPVLIIGCGPIGALSAIVASQESERAVLVADRNAERADAVSAFVGHQAASSHGELPSMTDHGVPVHHILDTTGNVAVLDELIARFAGATIGLVGIGSGEISIDPVHLVEREIALVGCHAFNDELAQAVSQLERHPERFRPVLGQAFDLEDAAKAYEIASSGHGRSIKTLFKIGGHV
ncbi:alcohol dehydrogenase catalytic domain-containing protein [Roseitalea sp. MMSF_3504]|uniref:zinc-dependent alcohol dehydrogenase n=2 Tax=Roseitalea TaxID=1915401 RepID=UPI00273F3CE6|nr:alcohol dehydrogenase catalytic domain-containing protein [Roseitalea sp. MMSF_3504]